MEIRIPDVDSEVYGTDIHHWREPFPNFLGRENQIASCVIFCSFWAVCSPAEVGADSTILRSVFSRKRCAGRLFDRQYGVL